MIAEFTAWLRERRGLRFADYRSLQEWSVRELETFWECVWEFFALDCTYERVLSGREMPGARWFEGAELNYAEQVLARAGSIVAYDEAGGPHAISAAELRGRVGALAAHLRALGVGPGDRVVAYVPNIPEAIVGMLATTSIGAIWAACAPDFGTQSVIDRFAQLEPSVLVAVDGYTFGGRRHDRSDVVGALEDALPTLRATVPAGIELPACEPVFEQVAFDHPLWVLFSSGTTGIPKGIVHGHGGVVVEHLKALGLCLDMGPDDVYLFHSSTSWMAWNYLVGGLLHGATIVAYDGSPAFPDPHGLWQLADEAGATVLGMGAAYVTACQKAGVTLDGLDSLRTVIPTGSPLPPAGWDWLAEQLPERTRIDPICGGTDVCTAFFGGSPLLPVRKGQISGTWLGIAAEAWDPDGRPLVGEVGEFVVTQPMPSMPVGLWGDADGERLRDSYFDVYPGAWRQGDWVSISADGFVRVLGRSDATLNKGGVRMGSAEIYAVVERLPEVLDSLVVGIERDDGGYYMPLFVVPAAGAEVDAELVGAALRTELSPRHVPTEVVSVPALPRTLTGKKLEVPVKRILQGSEPGAVVALGSIDKPDALSWFADYRSSTGL